MVRLDLLTKQEAGRRPEEYTNLPDPVRGLLLLAKEERNAPVHSAKKPRPDERSLRLQAAGAVILTPVFKHACTLKTSLDRLVTAPLIDDPEADVNNEFQRLIQSIASERRRHLEHFAGRKQWLQTVSRAPGGEIAAEGRLPSSDRLRGYGEVGAIGEGFGFSGNVNGVGKRTWPLRGIGAASGPMATRDVAPHG